MALNILRKASVTGHLKEGALEAFVAASTPSDLERRLDPLEVPDEVKADLWDAKFCSQSGKSARPNPTSRRGCSVILQIHLETEGRSVPKSFFGPIPDWYAQAIRADIDLSLVPESEKPGQEAVPFVVAESISRNVLFVVPGLFLTAAGLSLVIFVKKDKSHPQLPDG